MKQKNEVVTEVKGKEVVTQWGEITQLEVADEQPSIVKAPTQEEIQARRDRIADLHLKKPENCPSIVVRYWEARQGDELRGIFKGWKILQKKDPSEPEGVKQIPAVVIETLEGEYLMGSMQIVEAFLGRIPEDSGVYIKCTKAKANEMKEFDIRLLSY